MKEKEEERNQRRIVGRKMDKPKEWEDEQDNQEGKGSKKEQEIGKRRRENRQMKEQIDK